MNDLPEDMETVVDSVRRIGDEVARQVVDVWLPDAITGAVDLLEALLTMGVARIETAVGG